VCSFASHGIIHCDIRKDNILFSQQPSRVVVIDFGESILREDESDSEWESIVTTEGNERLVKQLLHEAGIRDLRSISPLDYEWSPRRASLECDGQNAGASVGALPQRIGRVPVGSDLMSP
jgi:serine/threonine protein kinase